MQVDIEVSRIFNALGDPTRLAIYKQVTRGAVSISQLAEPLKISLSAVTQHLRVLEECGLVTSVKTGRVRTCTANPNGLNRAEKWILDRKSLWERRLHRLGKFVDEND